MEMQESNKLIADFMGWFIEKSVWCYYGISPLTNRRTKFITQYEEKDLKYDKSWDWLMPCIQKISMDYEGLPELSFGHLSIDSPIEMVYEAVVEFLKQQNG